MEIINYNAIELDEKIASKESLLATLNADIADKQAVVLRLSQELLVLNEQIKTAYDSIPLVQNDLESLKTALRDTQAQVDIANATREDFARQNASYATAIAKAKQELSEVQSLTASLPRLRADYEEAKQQTQILNAQLFDKKSLVVQEEARANRIKAETEARLLEVQSTLATMAKETEKLSKLSESLDARKKALDERERTIRTELDGPIPVTLRRHLEGKIRDLALKVTVDKLISGYNK